MILYEYTLWRKKNSSDRCYRNCGSEVVKQLALIFLSSDYNNTRAAVHGQNKVDKLEQYADKGVEIVSLDHTKPETISNALDKVDKIFDITNS